MGGWRKRGEEENKQNGHGTAEPERSLPQAALPAFAPPPMPAPMPSIAPDPPPLFCPECGQRLNYTASYVPKFCTHCGHRFVPLAAQSSGLDALLQATAAAKASGQLPAASGANVTLMSGSQTLMGASRTLMGVPRADLYPGQTRSRSGATRARIQEARRPGGSPARTRSLPAPEPRRVPALDPPPAVVPEARRAATPALPPVLSPIPVPAPPLASAPPPAPAPAKRSSLWEESFFVFSSLLLLALLAAAATFWLARRGVLVFPF